MCGIIACRTRSTAAAHLLTGLRRLEYRGYDSVGIAVRTVGGDVVRMRTVRRVGALERAVGEWTGAAFSGVGIGHTRWATHGPATEVNAHPHVDCTGRISVVHNGVIENADELRHDLVRSGHCFASGVDSEVLCHLVEDQLTLAGDLLTAVQGATLALDGSWAIAVLEERTGRLVVSANRSPLLVAHGKVGDFAASDISAIADWVDEFQVLEDGDVVELTGVNGWHDPERTMATPALTRYVSTVGDSGLAGYADFMAKEIDEQSECAARVLDEVGDRIANGSLWSDLRLQPFERVQVIGCGTSLNAGHVIENVARRVGRIPVTRLVASEAGASVYEPNTLRLAISQSGETADVLSAVGEHVVAGSPVLALVNNAHSTLARRADAVVTCSAGPEFGVAATKTFTCQVVAGVAVVISALVASDRLSRPVAEGLADDLRRLPDRLAAAGSVAKVVVPTLADELVDASGFVFIARGAGLPYAAEGALKLKELSYRWAEHYPAGELKHGPLAVIGHGTPVVVVDDGSPKLATNVSEVRARGGLVISMGSRESTIPVAGDPAAPWGPIECVLPLQILARSLALAIGNDVDKPRNLAKSVTVE